MAVSKGAGFMGAFHNNAILAICEKERLAKLTPECTPHVSFYSFP